MQSTNLDRLPRPQPGAVKRTATATTFLRPFLPLGCGSGNSPRIPGPATQSPCLRRRDDHPQVQSEAGPSQSSPNRRRLLKPLEQLMNSGQISTAPAQASNERDNPLAVRGLAPASLSHPPEDSIAFSRSAVNGTCRIRLPVASKIAF